MSKPSHFLGKPTLGGKLTILNCLMWGVFAIGIVTNQNLLMLPALIACWPIAWVFLLPILGAVGDQSGEIIVACMSIGANSFLWGYGISWIVSQMNKVTDRRQPRGFEVITGQDSTTPPP